MRLRAIYVDLDGTLLGVGGSLLRDGEGGFARDAVRALEACHRADVEVVLCSGRRREGLFHDARLMGLDSYVFEAGGGLVVRGETFWMAGGPTHDDITASGAPRLLLDHFAERLEYHEPWHTGREVSHLFRGAVDVDEANALLADSGHTSLRLLDNGVIRRTMPGVDRARAYHLVPEGVSKARAIAMHMQIRGLRRREVVAIGDSREDAGAAGVVQTFWFVGNAVRADPSLRSIRGHNLRIAQGSWGAGVYEAVVTELSERA